MTRPLLDVGVIGGGTAGCAVALLLSRQGHAVTVYERVAVPGPVGAGITLQPTGLHVLEELGVYDAVVSRGARIDRLACTTPTGRTVIELSYGDVSPAAFGVGMHRGALFAALFSAAKSAPGVTFRLGLAAEDLRRASTRGWQWILDDAGVAHGPHQLIVVCDGARSHLRDDTHVRKSIDRYPWGALWFVGDDPVIGGAPVLRQVVRGSSWMVGLLPTGLGPDPTNETPLVSLFYSIREDAVPAWRARGLEAWKDEVRASVPDAATILDQVTDADQLLFAAYHDVVMDPWNTSNVVYLGDAAHAMSPQLGQGANLALFDAWVLAEALAAEPYLPLALDRYTRARRGHLGFYQFATRALTPFFQGDEPWFGVLRDLFMPLAAWLPPTRWFMTAAMTGAIESFTGRRIAVADPRRVGPLVK